MFRVEHTMIRVLSHSLPRSALVIAVMEVLILASSMYLVIHYWPWQQADGQDLSLPLRIAEFSVGMFAIMAIMGLYTQESLNGWRGILFRLLAAFMLGGLMLWALVAMGRHGDLNAYPAAVGAALALVVISLERLAVFRLHDSATAVANRALVLGCGTRAAMVDSLLSQQTNAGASHVVGYLPVNDNQAQVPGERLLTRKRGETLLDVVQRHRVGEVVVAVRDRRRGLLPLSELLECKLRGVRVTDLPSFFEREGARVNLDSLSPGWIIFGNGFKSGRLRTFNKRLFDLLSATVLVLLALPLIVLTALVIRLSMGSPVLYWQERVGLDGRHFHICKFRSMRNDAESDGRARWAEQNDDRITPVGRIIRKLRIDELPQLYNVVRGDMGLVGPRPERPTFVSELGRDIPFYGIRHSVKPGITGWAQVLYPYGASLEDARNKLQFDLYYIKNHSLLLDATIVLMTVKVVLWGSGAR